LGETMQSGAPGLRHAMQPQTGTNGMTMSKPYVPAGMEKLTVKAVTV